ncbi:MAG: hypothetical protein O3A51_03305 [Verrucomicrobia bacterium]|nr:hypothetical protein [Verrucomicrobiota bacterium]
MPSSQTPDPDDMLAAAHRRIAELEKALDDAISLLVSRDEQLLACERKLKQLERDT